MKNKFFISFLALISLVNVFAVDTTNWVKGPDKSWMLTVEDALVKAKKTKKKFMFSKPVPIGADSVSD